MATDNSAVSIKVELRKKAIKIVGGIKKACVLDLYAGKGEMRKLCYQGCKEYQGVDKKYERDDCIKIDNKSILRYILPQKKWNIIDLDAYGNPFGLAIKTSEFLGHGKYQMILTSALMLDLNRGPLNKNVLDLIGWNMDGHAHGLLGGKRGWHDEIVRWYFDLFDGEITDIEYRKPGDYAAKRASYYRITLEK